MREGIKICIGQVLSSKQVAIGNREKADEELNLYLMERKEEARADLFIPELISKTDNQLFRIVEQF